MADRLDLRRDIRLGTRVVSAVYDESDPGWTIETEQGERLTAEADYEGFVFDVAGTVDATGAVSGSTAG